MPAHPYLTDEELALLGQLYRQEQSESRLNLTLSLDAGIRPLLEQASQLELKMEIGDVTLHFPVSLDTRSHDEQAQVSTPDILTGDEAHPRAWRLPSPRELRLLEHSGRPLAADIRDLSIGGMRLLSRRCLFRRQGGSTLCLIFILLAFVRKISYVFQKETVKISRRDACFVYKVYVFKVCSRPGFDANRAEG